MHVFNLIQPLQIEPFFFVMFAVYDANKGLNISHVDWNFAFLKQMVPPPEERTDEGPVYMKAARATEVSEDE